MVGLVLVQVFQISEVSVVVVIRQQVPTATVTLQLHL